MIRLIGEINKKNTLPVIDKVISLKKPSEFWLSTNGGLNSYTKLLIREIEKKLDLLTLYIFEECSSNGQTIFFNFPIEKRFAVNPTQLTFHNHNMDMNGTFTKKELKRCLKQLTEMDNLYYKSLKYVNKEDIKAIDKLSLDEETIGIKELIKHGFLLKNHAI